MKIWLPLAIALLTLILAQSQRILSASDDLPKPPRHPKPNDPPHEIPATSAIRAKLIPGDLPGILISPSFSPDGKLIATENSQGIKLYGTHSGGLIRSFEINIGGPIFVPQGRAFAAWIALGQWGLFDSTTGQMIRAMDPQPGLTSKNVGYTTVFSPDGKWFAASFDTGEVIIWDVVSGKRRHVLPPVILPAFGISPASPRNPVVPARPDRIRSLAFSPNAATLYTGGEKIRAWNLAGTSDPRRLDLSEDQPCSALAASPDGETLAVAVGHETNVETDHKIVLLDAATERKKAEIITSTKAVRGVAFRLRGRQVITLEGDRILRLWDVDEAKPIAACRFDSHFEFRQLAVSPDGRLVAAAGLESDAIFGAIGMVEIVDNKFGPWQPAP